MKMLIFFFGALGALLFGFDTGVISGAILFIRQEFHLSPLSEGWVVSSVLVGAAIGAVFSGALSDRIGRRRVVLIESLIFIVGTLGSALAGATWELIVFRGILGVAVGGASALVPLYLSEMAPAEVRGALSGLNQLMVVIGILLSYVAGYAFSASGDWRWMLGVGVVPAVAMLIGMLFMPESPRWLVSQGRTDEARAVLSRTRESAQAIDDELADIVRVNAEEEGGFKELLKPWIRPVLWVGIGLGIFQQFIGINAVIYYAPTILTAAGLGTSVAFLGTIGTGIAELIMTIVALALIDRWGRKPLLITGNILMSASLFVLALVNKLFGMAPGVAWVTVLSLVVYVAAFSFSWGPVMWVLLSEVFPLKVRGAAMSIASVVVWLADLVVSLLFPVLLAAIGIADLFLIYGVIGILAILFVKLFVMETKGRSLEQIETTIRQGRLQAED